MNEARERDLLAHVPTLATLDEALGFRAQASAQNEMTGALLKALAARIDRLVKQEGTR
jgi:hypothetical protein